METNRKQKNIFLQSVAMLWQTVVWFERKPSVGCLEERRPMRMNERLGLIAAAAVAVITVLFPGAARAEMAPPNHRMCHNAVEIAKQLASKYDEIPVANGLQSDGRLAQVYASAETGTWTIIVINPDGWACVVAAGKHWERLQPKNHDPRASFEPSRGGSVAAGVVGWTTSATGSTPVLRITGDAP